MKIDCSRFQATVLWAMSIIIRSSRDVCFNNWPAQRILEYVVWHLKNDTISFADSGLGFAWRGNYARIVDLNARGLSCFEWREEVEFVDCVFIAEVIGDAASMRKLCLLAKRRYPEAKRFVTFRREKLVDVTKIIERLAT